MNDLISRQLVMETLCERRCGDKPKGCPAGFCPESLAVDCIPSADVPDRKVGKWIPCKKQMPKPNETVNCVRKYYLVQNVFGDMMVASYRAKGDKTWWEQMYKYEPTTDEIVAWMELPETYKEGGEE